MGKNKRKRKSKRQSKKSVPKIVDVGGGGDCFYRVIAHQLGKKPSSFMKIRREIADYISKNIETYSIYFDGEDETQKFISSIRKRGSWCEGEIEMQVVTKLYKVNLIIKDDNGNVTKIENHDATKNLKIYHIIDVHFQSIVE
tara:strand:+ start:256 stop:681 length:426 start_codon:yes stop_codon:yes gene_type:complete